MKTIVFEDHGQDFLEWEIDDKGVVTGCRPFQGSIWGGKRVLNHRSVKAGGKARICIEGCIRSIKHPLVSVRTTK